MSARKRWLIRVVETVLRPLVRLSRLKSSEARMQEGDARKILVMEYWNLGDVVMLTPFLRSLRIHYPAASITLVTSPKAAPLMENQGLVDQVLTVRVPWAQHYSRWRKYNPFSRRWMELFRTIKLLRARQFDLAFTARADLRENFILWLARVKRRIGYGFGGGEFLLTDPVVPDLRQPHFANRWLRLLEYEGKGPLVRLPSLQVTAVEEESTRKILEDYGVGEGDFLVAIHPGARSSTRQWGEENFLDVENRLRLRFPVKFAWFQDSKPIIAPTRQGKPRPLVLPLRQFMAALRRCGLLICNDSGPMHIAAALGVPVVAVFGPTEPAWFAPMGKGHHVVSQPGFWCRPCFDYCLFDQPYCLRTLSVDSVFQASAQALASLLSNPHHAGSDEESPLPVTETRQTAS